MKVTYVPVDNLVIVNGRTAEMPITAPDDVNVIQWDTDTSTGVIERHDVTQNEAITSLPSWCDGLLDKHNQICTEEDQAQAEAIAYANSPEGKAEVIRRERDGRLFETDWWELPSHGGMSVEEANYRQALRDVTTQATFPESVEWPVSP